MRLLIIEDDSALCEALALHLTREGYEVDVCHSGGDAPYYLQSDAYSAVVLDRMLPETDGLTLLREYRAAGHAAPVLMLTAMDTVDDRTAGLDAGADDYLGKPFAMAELLSRLRALLRRPGALQARRELSYGDLQFFPRERTLRQGEREVTLSGREAGVLELFLEAPETPLSRRQILSRVWGGDESVEDGNVDNYIYFVRRRLRALESRVTLKSVHGLGYLMTEDERHG